MNIILKNIAHAALLAFATISLSGLASTELEVMDAKEFNEAYIASSFSISTQRKAYIEDVPVSFSKEWLTSFESNTSASYRSHIKKTYGAAFKTELEKEFKKQGWEVLSSPSEKTITVQAQLIDLNIFAPQTINERETLLFRNAGSLGVNISFYSSNGATLMKLVDAHSTPPIVGSPFANRSVNFKYFKMLLSNWAHLSSAYLETLMEMVEIQSKR